MSDWRCAYDGTLITIDPTVTVTANSTPRCARCGRSKFVAPLDPPRDPDDGSADLNLAKQEGE